MVHDLLEFLGVVAWKWQALVTGGVLVAAVSPIERRRGKSIPWHVIRPLIVLTLVFACFQAWREERTMRVQAQGSTDLRAAVVTAIRELKGFRAQRLEIEIASDRNWRVENDSRELFLKQFSQRLVKLSGDLPLNLVQEARLIRETSESPVGGGVVAIDGLISTLESVSASL